MTWRNPMPTANKTAIIARVREMVALDCTNAEIAADLQHLWPNASQHHVNQLTIALGLRGNSQAAPQPSLRRFSWQQGDAA